MLQTRLQTLSTFGLYDETNQFMDLNIFQSEIFYPLTTYHEIYVLCILMT